LASAAACSSNFPPDKQSCGYTELWNAFKIVTKAASAAEKTALYSGTAPAYRMASPSDSGREPDVISASRCQMLLVEDGEVLDMTSCTLRLAAEMLMAGPDRQAAMWPPAAAGRSPTPSLALLLVDFCDCAPEQQLLTILGLQCQEAAQRAAG
jgi:hypothetical protein